LALGGGGMYSLIYITIYHFDMQYVSSNA